MQLHQEELPTSRIPHPWRPPHHVDVCVESPSTRDHYSAAGIGTKARSGGSWPVSSGDLRGVQSLRRDTHGEDASCSLHDKKY